MTDTAIMELTETTLADAEARIIELTALIDSWFPETINRNLMRTDEFQDFLLDARNILNRQN